VHQRRVALQEHLCGRTLLCTHHVWGNQGYRQHRVSTKFWGSWIKRDQLDVTCFIISLFNGQHVSDVSTSILRSLRLICYFMGCIDLVRCVLVLRCGLAMVVWYPYAGWGTSASACLDVCWCYVVVWLWWCCIRTQAEALAPQPAYGYHTTTAKPQRNTNTHRTRAIQPM